MSFPKKLAALLFGLLLASQVSSCGTDQIRSPKPQSDWSRGLRVGVAEGLTQPSLLVEGDGTAHIAWTADTSLNFGEIGYSRIAPNGEQTARSSFQIPESHLRGAALRMVRGSVEVCWVSDLGIRCSPLNEDGSELTEPFQLVSAPPEILTYSLAGESYAWVDEDGNLFASIRGASPSQVAGDVLNVNFTLQEDHLILTWSAASDESETTFWVAAAQAGGIGTPHRVSRLTSGITAGLRQIGLGSAIVGNDLCVVYGYEFTRGLEGGTAETDMYCLNRQTLTLTSGQSLELTIPQKIAYTDYQGSYSLTRLAVPDIPSSNFTYLPSGLLSRGGQLALAVSTPAQYRYQFEQQIALLILQDGRIIGYQPVSATTNASLFPNLAQDEAGNLYLAWLERGIGKDIYFTTTNPQAAGLLNPLTLGEVTVKVIGVVVEAVTGLFLLPFALLWVVAGFVIYFVVSTLGRWIRLKQWADRIAFLAGLITLWVSKLLFIPQMTSYLPFEDYLPEFSPGLTSALMVFLPVLILAVSFGLSRWIVKRREIESLPIQFGIYALLDITLTALLYGAMLQGAGG